MVGVGKRYVGEIQLAFALDPDLVRAVHHDLGDPVVVEEVLDRSVADDLREDGILKAQAVGAVYSDVLVVQRGREVFRDHRPHLLGARCLDVSTEERGHACVNAVHELYFGVVAEPAQLQNVRAPVGLGDDRWCGVLDHLEVGRLDAGDRRTKDGHPDQLVAGTDRRARLTAAGSRPTATRSASFR